VAVKPNSGNDGLSLIARTEYIMAKKQHTKTEAGSASSTSGDLTKPPSKANMPLGESRSLSSGITATTQNDSQKTLTSAKLEELRSRIGLVAGALADWQTAGGLVAIKNMTGTLASGRTVKACRVVLAVDGYQLYVKMTPDGLDFDLVAE
jgi:hypothetical protein